MCLLIAETRYQEALALARQMGDHTLQGIALTDLGALATGRGDYQQAEAYLQEGRSLAHKVQYTLLTVYTLGKWGELSLKQHRLEQACANIHEMLLLAEKMASKGNTGLALYGLARVAAAEGKLLEACQQGQQSSRLLEAIGYYKAGEAAAWQASLPREEGRPGAPLCNTLEAPKRRQGHLELEAGR